MPVLRLRLAAPETLVDLGRIDELRGVRDDGDAIVIGAMTPHDASCSPHPLVERACAADRVGDRHRSRDPQIRHRGTFGGALAHADPAGDLPAVACWRWTRSS